MLVSRTIDIAAPAGTVWALVVNPLRRAQLNPAVKVLDVRVEGDGPLRPGSSTQYRLEIDGRIVEYRTRVLSLVPGLRLVTRSDSAVPFETTIELAPLTLGTRLSHSERLEPTPGMIQRAIEQLDGGREPGWRERLILLVDGDAGERLRDRALEHLETTLGAVLERWLASMRTDLEQGSPAGGRLPA